MAGAAAALALALVGCGAATARHAPVEQIPAALARQARPIGRGPRFHPPARGPVLGPCRRRLGPRDAAHVELFAADRVVLVAAGIGTRGPRRHRAGRIAGARCYGALVTLDPTGVVLVRRHATLTVADLFTSWGQALGAHRIAAFRGRSVLAFVDGRRHRGPVARDPPAAPRRNRARARAARPAAPRLPLPARRVMARRQFSPSAPPGPPSRSSPSLGRSPAPLGCAGCTRLRPRALAAYRARSALRIS